MTFDLTPREYESGEMSTGSRTIDPGQSITIGYDDSRGFYAARKLGVWDVADLFGEMDYWPCDVVWTGQSERLSAILDELCLQTGLAARELRDLVFPVLEGRSGVDVEAYLLKEEAGEVDEDFESDRGALFGEYRIAGLPSESVRSGSFYSGLELEFDDDGWKAKLVEPNGDEAFLVEGAGEWEGETFDELLLTNDDWNGSLLDCLPWTRDELVDELIRHDATWRVWCAIAPQPARKDSFVPHIGTMVDSVLLHIPHSSTEIPDDVRAGLLIDAEELERELSAMTDHHTDDLFAAEGADRLVLDVSRLVVDPERFADDAKEPMASRGMGAVYTRTSAGKPLRSGADRAELMARYYEPHHRCLNEWAKAALARHGCCLVIDCHSFPSSPLACDLDPLVERPLFCVGTDPFHTPPALRDALVVGLQRIADQLLELRETQALRARSSADPTKLAEVVSAVADLARFYMRIHAELGVDHVRKLIREEAPDLSVDVVNLGLDRATRAEDRCFGRDKGVLVDRPYAGTMVPSMFYGTDARVASVMIEVNRGLYMDEATGQRCETYPMVRGRLKELLEGLAEAWREQVVSRAANHTPQEDPQPRQNPSSPASGNTSQDSEETFTGLSEYGQALVMEQLKHRGLEDTPSNREKLAKEYDALS